MITTRLNALDYAIIAASAVLSTVVITALTIAIDYSNLAGLGGEQLATNLRNDLLIPILLGLPNFTVVFWKIRQLAKARDQLEKLASTDSLTGTLNRRAFQTRAENLLAEAGSNGLASALLVIDIDHFKNVNDSFGHDIGDKALASVAAAIGGQLRHDEVFGRIGGEEFVVFMPRTTTPMAALMAERLRAAVQSSTFAQETLQRDLTVSIGVATCRGRTPFTELYKEADACLYQAKERGRNRVVLTSMEEKAGATGGSPHPPARNAVA